MKTPLTSSNKPLPLHGILLLGGTGSRVKRAVPGNKHLAPIAGRPMAEYGVELLQRCGAEEITAIVRPEDEHTYRELFAHTDSEPVPHIVVQPSPAGTADALQRCTGMVVQPVTATLWGDNLFEFVPEIVDRFIAGPSAARIAVTAMADPRPFSTVEIDNSGRVRAIVDKPAHPTSDAVCTGLMVFDTGALFAVLPSVRPNARGERDMMDAVRAFMTAGALRCDPITGSWFDAAVSPQSLYAAEHFAAHRGFNHIRIDPANLENSWTSITPRDRYASTSTPPAAAS